MPRKPAEPRPPKAPKPPKEPKPKKEKKDKKVNTAGMAGGGDQDLFGKRVYPEPPPLPPPPRKEKPSIAEARDGGFRFYGTAEDVGVWLRRASHVRWVCTTSLHRSYLAFNDHYLLIWTYLNGKYLPESRRPASREAAETVIKGEQHE